jgi:hypothetical protein
MSAAPRHSREALRRRLWFSLLVGAAALGADAMLNSAWAAGARGTNESTGRYLFIVDTSFAMQRRAANTRKVVGGLLLSGLNGQLRPGDSIGVWTFNQDLNAGSFPLQLWLPQARQRIATSVVEFLQRQRYEKRTQMDKALAPMMRLVKTSDKITVLLICSGDDKISGTPFDGDINEAFKLNSSAQRKSQMPFVAVFRARKGEWIGGIVSTPPWPVEFPGFPAEPQIVVSPISPEKPKPEAPKPAPTRPTVPSLIVIGKKPEPPAPAPTNATPTDAAKPETTLATAPMPLAEVPKPAPGTAATNPPEAHSIVRNPESAVPQPTPPATPHPPPIATTPPPVAAVTSAPGKSETAPSSRTDTTASPFPVTAIMPDKPKVQAPPGTPPAPAPSVASTSVAATVPPAPSSPAAAGNSGPPTSAPAPAPVVQTALATPSESVFGFTGILIAGAALLVVALGLVYAFVRRSRTTTQVSLITRSMDRDQK